MEAPLDEVAGAELSLQVSSDELSLEGWSDVAAAAASALGAVPVSVSALPEVEKLASTVVRRKVLAMPAGELTALLPTGAGADENADDQSWPK
jgi:hypothetical protein